MDNSFTLTEVVSSLSPQVAVSGFGKSARISPRSETNALELSNVMPKPSIPFSSFILREEISKRRKMNGDHNMGAIPRRIAKEVQNQGATTGSNGTHTVSSLSDLRLLLILQEKERQKEELRKHLMIQQQQLLLRHQQEKERLENMLLLSQQPSVLQPSLGVITDACSVVRDGSSFNLARLAPMEGNRRGISALPFSLAGAATGSNDQRAQQQHFLQMLEQKISFDSHEENKLIQLRNNLRNRSTTMADNATTGTDTNNFVFGHHLLELQQHLQEKSTGTTSSAGQQQQLPRSSLEITPTESTKSDGSDSDTTMTSKRGKKFSFKERLAQLKAFKEKFGHINVSQRPGNEYASLGNWVNTQRTHYKRFKKGKESNITEERVKLLNSLGFVWTPTFTWDEMYQRLCWHNERYGNINIPTRYKNRQYNRLGKWLYVQRHRYQLLKQGKKSPLKPNQIQLLEGLGIDWSMQGGKNGTTPNTFDCRDSMVHKKGDIAAASLAAAEAAVKASVSST